MITEKDKQEADSIVEKYYDKVIILNEHEGIRCAIQDRQSVLDALQKAYNIEDVYNATCDYIYNEIQSLNNQIDYLKSKL